MCGGIWGEYTSFSDCQGTHIIPTALIVAMILLALVVACLLSRRARRYKRTRTHEDTLNGVPVIFLDELDKNSLWNLEHESSNIPRETRTDNMNCHQSIAQAKPKKSTYPAIPPPPDYQKSIALMGSSIGGPSAYPVMTRPVSQSSRQPQRHPHYQLQQNDVTDPNRVHDAYR